MPINPHEAIVEGEPAYRSVLDYPGTIDEATLYVHPEVGVAVIDELAEKKIPAVWLNPGADGPEVVAPRRGARRAAHRRLFDSRRRARDPGY